MQKSYINNAVTGNSSMLACFSDKAELLRLYWPHIDYLQQFDRLLCGIFINNKNGSTVWFHDHSCEHRQSYIEDTNIIKSTVFNSGLGFKADIYDFVCPERDVLVRRFEIQNTSGEIRELGFVSFSAASNHSYEAGRTLFDFSSDALIHYRNDSYAAITSDRTIAQFQIGNNAYEAAVNTYLYGKDEIGMMKDAAVSWKLGSFEVNETKNFNLYICMGKSLKDCKLLAHKVKQIGAVTMLKETEAYWQRFLSKTNKFRSSNTVLDNLYKRSLLVFGLMSDKSGGLLAAPELDEYFTRSGGYAYCWGRDAAFITEALDVAGLYPNVDRFYRWAAGVQDQDGSWQQRFHMDGNLGPCWGLQVDETGSLLWGMLEHYKITKNQDFLKDIWNSVQAGADFLMKFIDEETGLPKPSFDLWEERYGEHAYSSAAVYGGLISAAKIAGVLKKPEEIVRKWVQAAGSIRQAIEKHFWKEEYRRFIRSVRVKLNGFGQEPPGNTMVIKVNAKNYMKEVTMEDWLVDVSLLGISVPFGVYSANDPRMRDTVALVEKVLTVGDSNETGGIMRYEHDNYIGGNPWLLTTLWVALYQIEAGNYDKAREYLLWAVKGQTEMGLLPEQVNRVTGQPEWVIPLTWSHAMYVLVYTKLVNLGVI